MSAPSDLRIRLEGRVEKVEDACEHLDALIRLAAPRRWQREPALRLNRLRVL